MLTCESRKIQKSRSGLLVCAPLTPGTGARDEPAVVTTPRDYLLPARADFRLGTRTVVAADATNLVGGHLLFDRSNPVPRAMSEDVRVVANRDRRDRRRILIPRDS